MPAVAADEDVLHFGEVAQAVEREIRFVLRGGRDDLRLARISPNLPVLVRAVVRDGAAPSYSAFVQRALADGVNRAREALLAEAFLSASRDPEFLEDVDRALRKFEFPDDGEGEDR